MNIILKVIYVINIVISMFIINNSFPKSHLFKDGYLFVFPIYSDDDYTDQTNN